MKRILLLIPCLGVSAFGAYYQHWTEADAAFRKKIAAHPLAIYAYRDGRRDARADLAHDRLRLLAHGERCAEFPEYQDMLHRIYGVSLDYLTPEPSRDLQRYATGYNAVVEEHIAATFGRDTLANLREWAQRRHALAVRIASYVPPG